MKYLTFPFLLLLLPLIGSGCSSEEKETDSLILSSDSEIFFEQGIDFAATSGTRNLSFSSGRPWRISLTTDTDTRRAADWCTVSPSSGTAGDASVTISIQENADYDSRSVKLTLVAGGIEKSFTVSQKQKDALTLTASRFEVGKEGGTVQVEVKADITFEVEIPEVDRSWISQANPADWWLPTWLLRWLPMREWPGVKERLSSGAAAFRKKSGSRRREDVTTD